MVYSTGETIEVGDFVKTDIGLIGFVVGVGEIRYGRKYLPAVRVRKANNQEDIALVDDGLTLIDKAEAEDDVC